MVTMTVVSHMVEGKGGSGGGWVGGRVKRGGKFHNDVMTVKTIITG